MSYLYLTVGVIIGIALCIAFPRFPDMIHKAIRKAQQDRLDNYAQGLVNQS